MNRRRRRVSSRTIASFGSTLLLTALVAIVFGLDWQAALWGEGFDSQPTPEPSHSYYLERVDAP